VKNLTKGQNLRIRNVVCKFRLERNKMSGNGVD
jgi:hypothetical protein